MRGGSGSKRTSTGRRLDWAWARASSSWLRTLSTADSNERSSSDRNITGSVIAASASTSPTASSSSSSVTPRRVRPKMNHGGTEDTEGSRSRSRFFFLETNALSVQPPCPPCL